MRKQIKPKMLSILVITIDSVLICKYIYTVIYAWPIDESYKLKIDPWAKMIGLANNPLVESIKHIEAIMLGLHSCVILALVMKNYLQQNKYSEIINQTIQNEDPFKESIHEKEETNNCFQFMYGLVDLFKYCAFHYCHWLGYYAVIIILFLTENSIINILQVTWTCYMLAHNIY